MFTPLILRTFDNADDPQAEERLRLLAGDPRVQEAVSRLAVWDFSTPTGIPEGYDANDRNGALAPPSAEEIEQSIAATIYALWRSRIIANTIDVTLQSRDLPSPDSDQDAIVALRNLFDSFDQCQGFGASGLNFFEIAEVANPAARRDIKILQSLYEALDLLAGEAFAPVRIKILKFRVPRSIREDKPVTRHKCCRCGRSFARIAVAN